MERFGHRALVWTPIRYTLEQSHKVWRLGSQTEHYPMHRKGGKASPSSTRGTSAPPCCLQIAMRGRLTIFTHGDNFCEGRQSPQSTQCPSVSCSAGACSAASISNVRQLKAAIRTVQPNTPACIRLLNATGTVGCGAGITVGPIATLENPKTSVPSGAAACLCWCLPATSGMIVWRFLPH